MRKAYLSTGKQSKPNISYEARLRNSVELTKLETEQIKNIVNS